MKLSLCAALLLCASYVMAANVVIRCTGALKNSCPSNYEQEFHGKTALESECFCVRPETKEEEAKRANDERPQRCKTALSQCRMYDSNYASGFGSRAKGCDQAMEYCERKDIDLLCYDLKKRNAKWECKNASSYGTRLANDEAKARQKVCDSVKETCEMRGQYFGTTDKKGKSCEDFVRTCPKAEVIAFCKKHNYGKQGKWKCENSPAYKARKEVHTKLS